MPQVSLIPFPDPQANLRISWPRQGQGLTVGGPFDNIGFVEDFQVPVTWQASIGAGANTMDYIDDVLCALFSTAVQRTYTPFPLIVPTVANLAPGLIMPQQQRIYRLQWIMRMVAPPLDRASGVTFSPSSVLSPSFTDAGGAAFGIVGDGAGAWEYLQSGVGAFPGNITAETIIPASIVPDATDWNSFDIEIINSAPGRAATLSLFVNNVFVLSKNWTTFVGPDTGPLPLPSVVAGGNKFIWTARAATAATGFFMGPLVVDMGRFTRAGLELLQ